MCRTKRTCCDSGLPACQNAIALATPTNAKIWIPKARSSIARSSQVKLAPLYNGKAVTAMYLQSDGICCVRATKTPPKPEPPRRAPRRKPDDMLLDEYFGAWQKAFRERLAEPCRLSPDLSPEPELGSDGEAIDLTSPRHRRLSGRPIGHQMPLLDPGIPAAGPSHETRRRGSS